MGFEWSCKPPSRRVRAKSDGLRMLVGHIEDVPKIHQEGVSVPA